MKTYPLHLDDNYHAAIKRSAKMQGLSIRDFIQKAIDICLDTDDYLQAHPEIVERIKNTKRKDLIEISSMSELFEQQ